MGCPQEPIPIKIENSIATAFLDNNLQITCSKPWYMKLYWLRDEDNRQHFKVFLDKGMHNASDYFTKRHATICHRNERRNYVKDQ